MSRALGSEFLNSPRREASTKRVGPMALGCWLIALSSVTHSWAHELRKVPPSFWLQRTELIEVIRERYPNLEKQDFSGTPLVTVLFSADGTVVATHLERLPDKASAPVASEAQFQRLGVTQGTLQYVGTARVAVGNSSPIVIFAARDSRDLDRALIEHYFPRAINERATDDRTLWILFDHDGRVIRTGSEVLNPKTFARTLEHRFSGIHTDEMMAVEIWSKDGKPVRNGAHHRLKLECVWLTGGSPVPSTSTP